MEDIDNIESESSKGYKNFLFFGSMRESVEILSPKQGNKLLRAIMIYGTEGKIEEEDPAILAILLSIKPNIDRTHDRYKDKLEYKKRKQAEKQVEDDAKQIKNNTKSSNNNQPNRPQTYH